MRYCGDFKTCCEETFDKCVERVKPEYGAEKLETDIVDRLTGVGRRIVRKSSGMTGLRKDRPWFSKEYKQARQEGNGFGRWNHNRK